MASRGANSSRLHHSMIILRFSLQATTALWFVTADLILLMSFTKSTPQLLGLLKNSANRYAQPATFILWIRLTLNSEKFLWQVRDIRMLISKLRFISEQPPKCSRNLSGSEKIKHMSMLWRTQTKLPICANISDLFQREHFRLTLRVRKNSLLTLHGKEQKRNTVIHCLKS